MPRLHSGFSHLIRRCPRPILAVPSARSSIKRVLLACDGSPKADEALFVARYLAQQWQVSLNVVTIKEKPGVNRSILRKARRILDQPDLAVSFVFAKGKIANILLNNAQIANSDMLIMGGYGYNPFFEVVLGSTVDTILRNQNRPVLICR